MRRRGMGGASGEPILRLSFINLLEEAHADDFASAVGEGLSPERKWLPPRFFYDEAGSELFERITELPEYYLTRCEEEILRRHAQEIVLAAGSPECIVEFGSGSSAKTRQLLRAALSTRPVEYMPIDISKDFLRQSAHALLQEFDGLSVVALAGEYYQAIESLSSSSETRLFLFLGS
ncbi:MAG TPA: L-histidine N(alpha)-methyltransferase, partial [Fimbriimonadaceae bacterium]|nr:L-histidine N(alpha)-methyltransferase [Fimbriimonadaceae bacterium]